MSLIDISYFVGDLTIPNPGDVPVAERITWYIQKYEQEFLRKLLGYPLYKAFITGLNVTPPAVPNQRLLDILYGKEYKNLQGYLTQWRGLIITDIPVFNLAGGYVYKRSVYMTVGVTAGLVSGATAATFDGSNGTDDWRGWIPIISRISVLKPGVDYNWDIDTGLLTLLKPNDEFGDREDFFAEFELRTDPVNSMDVSMNQSLIANYVYYWYSRATATQSTGIGEVRTNAENAVLQDPNQKMASAWNEMHAQVCEFIEFMDTNSSLTPEVYPEWQWIYRWDTIREFEFTNPIF